MEKNKIYGTKNQLIGSILYILGILFLNYVVFFETFSFIASSVIATIAVIFFIIGFYFYSLEMSARTRNVIIAVAVIVGLIISAVLFFMMS